MCYKNVEMEYIVIIWDSENDNDYYQLIIL